MRTVESAEVDESLPVDRVRAVLEEHPVRLAILFGSRVGGRVHQGSDIDVAVELDGFRPGDDGYNDVFFRLSADLSEMLRTDDVDLVDVHAASPELATAIFERGVLLVGDESHADELFLQLAGEVGSGQSPRERFDEALSRIDDHLG